MSSLKQTEANRLNAKKSTGPRTPAGKANSRFNALKAGIDAGAEAIPGEDPEQLRLLRTDYYDRFTPERPEQWALVDALIANDWLLRRLRKIEGQLWKEQIAGERTCSSFKPDTPLAGAFSSLENRLTRLQRRLDSADRAYHRALNQIRRLQQSPLEPFQPEPPVETVGQTPRPAAGPLAGHRPNADGDAGSQDTAPAMNPTSCREPAPAIGFVPSIPVALRPAPSTTPSDPPSEPISGPTVLPSPPSSQLLSNRRRPRR